MVLYKDHMIHQILRMDMDTDIDSVIVFASAPSSSDIIFGNLVANNFPTFDISDNKVDTFTADGSTTTFTLSRAVVNNDNILVALDGVMQYPSDDQNTRSYNVSGTGSNSLTFASAPAQWNSHSCKTYWFCWCIYKWCHWFFW